MSNEITAYFKGRVGVAESVYQYDYGKILIIDGLSLPAIFEVHFTTISEDDAITVIGQNNRVSIPNSCISIPGTVTAYIYLHTGENDGETEYVVRFAVNRRARPAYDGTDEEKTELESAIQTAIAMLQNPKKVNQPLDAYNQVYYGNAGQLLRTKGDGSTEWVDEGLPTDDQTAAAVSAWLDEHPEATTTVEDGSLTEAKLSTVLKPKVLKDYVTPEMFGAKGDGVTDDSVAVQAAFDSGYDVVIANTYLCNSTIAVTNAAERTISGFNINTSKLSFGNNAQLIIGSDSNVNELRMNNFAIVGNRTQESVLKIQYVTNVYLNEVNIAEGGTYLMELDHADIVFIDECIFAGSNRLGIWHPCAGIKMTSANPVYVSNCNIWNVTDAFVIIGTNRMLSLHHNWIEFVKRVVCATGVTIANSIIEVKNNNIMFSIHGNNLSYTDSRIVYLDTITTGFDITINVNDNWICYYTTHPTQALVELKAVPSTVNVNILRNNMFTRLQQMSAYALKVDAANSTRLNYEASTNADAPYGCATARVTNAVVSPKTRQIKNLNLVSDLKSIDANQVEGDIWYENGVLYIKDGNAVRSVVVSKAETITNIDDPETATTYQIAAKLNALMNILRRTLIVR